MWGKIRFLILNRAKRKKARPEVIYMGPEQWQLLNSNHKWRDGYGRRT